MHRLALVPEGARPAAAPPHGVPLHHFSAQSGAQGPGACSAPRGWGMEVSLQPRSQGGARQGQGPSLSEELPEAASHVSTDPKPR